jgi:hypothetical protein
MKTVVFLICIILTSCGQNSTTDNASSQSGTFQMNSFNDDNYKTIGADTNERTKFWNAVAVPIIKGDKVKVLSNMDFPVIVEWDKILSSENGINSATRENFQKVYDKFFNSNFISSISSQTGREFQVGQLRDTVWYTMYIGRQKGKSDWGVGLSLDYFKIDSVYKLKYVRAIAGDFYGGQ